MILIVEGTDGVGKTTYAKRVAQQLGAEYRHSGPPQGTDWYEEYVTSLDPAKDYVLDRWHVGEVVWPEVFGRKSLLTAGSFDACNMMLADMGAQVQIIVRDTMGIVGELERRGEKARQIERSLEGQYKYEELVKEGWLRGIHCKVLNSDDIHKGSTCST